MPTKLNYVHEVWFLLHLVIYVTFRWQHHEVALEVASFQNVHIGLDYTCGSGKTCSKNGLKRYIFIQFSLMVAP